MNSKIPRTGQITSFVAGDDGALRKGVAWPNPRFITNDDGTTTDNLTGLMWLTEASCIAQYHPSFDADGTAGDGLVTWQHALNFVKGLNQGVYACWTSGPSPPYDDWRLPNIRELLSLHCLEYYNPALSNAIGTGAYDPLSNPPFLNVNNWYWSSTTLLSYPGKTYAFVMPSSLGSALTRAKADNYYNVLAVRGPVIEGYAPVPKTGQTACSDEAGQTIDCAGTGQDGDIQAGAAWPSPRFEDNSDGTVTDLLTGLTWLKNAHCFTAVNWDSALEDCMNFHDGQCGLSDGSEIGDWRLPNADEFFSLIDLGQTTTPALPSGHPFTNVSKWSPHYFTNTRSPEGFQTWVYFVRIHEIQLSASGLHSAGYLAWPVKDGVGSRILCVNSDGQCGGEEPCYITIQAAMNAAEDGDRIKVYQGTYKEAPTNSTTGTVTISGGWNTEYSEQTGITEMYAPVATGGGSVKVLPKIRVIAPES